MHEQVDEQDDRRRVCGAHHGDHRQRQPAPRQPQLAAVPAEALHQTTAGHAGEQRQDDEHREARHDPPHGREHAGRGAGDEPGRQIGVEPGSPDDRRPGQSSGSPSDSVSAPISRRERTARGYCVHTPRAANAAPTWWR